MIRPASEATSHARPSDTRPRAQGWITGVEHYENFPVGSLLVPRALRPAVVAIYRFARYADDVADEGDAPAEQRLAELERLRRALGGARQDAHPVVDALREQIRGHRLPDDEFLALLSAFEQDVTVTRYRDVEELLDYCRRSADPVGRLVLQLFGARGPRTEPLSDAICTALQLINFLQDFAIDWSRGRLYLPLQDLNAAGLDEASIAAAVRAGRAPGELRDLFAQQARRCGALLESGAPLAGLVPTRLALELRAILAGGRRILEQFARDGFDPIARRPRIGWRDAPALIRLMFVKPARP
jgi:squalene synthase HpnC